MAIIDDLGFDVHLPVSWFPHDQDVPYVLIRVNREHARAWAHVLAGSVRRCYITDALLEERSATLGIPKADILAAKLPNAGATMAGDFGEILVYIYHAAREHPKAAVGPKKWRLKQDRTKPAPHSDVIHFVLPEWPAPSAKDVLLCSEVKTKSTSGASRPIKAAIEDSALDRTTRLARTLVWLKERALVEDLGDITMAQLERFIQATDHPPVRRRFHAVAIICSSLVDRELGDAPKEATVDCTVVVISVPELRQTYTAVFNAARRSVAVPAAPVRAGGS